MDKRLIKLLTSGKPIREGQMLDTYNQQIQEGVSCTIRTNINTANHHFIVEEAKIIEAGKLNGGRHQQDFVQHEDGICRTICTGHHASTPHLLKALVSEPLCSVQPNSHKFEFDPQTSIKPIVPALRATDYKAPHCVYEPISVAMRGRKPDNPSERGKSNGNYKQRIEMNESGVANTITSVQKDSMVAEPTYRIRKLTPRECFRLMGVDEECIDTIQSAGISNSQQYKMAGNSIVVDVLYHIFRKMFVETEGENTQMTLL